MRTIWLHIGIRKAGSTTIQNFLCKNQRQLDNLGYYYPTDFSEAARESFELGVNGQPQNGNLRDFITSPTIETVDRTIGKINFPENKDVIFSTEDFYLLCKNKKLLSYFKHTLDLKAKNHKIKIVVYLRRQDELLESLYRQYMKGRNEVDYIFDEKFIEDDEVADTLKFNNFLDVFGEIFGSENIVVRPFEKEQLIEQNVITDFLKQIGITDKSTLNINVSHNSQFSHEMTEFLRLTKNYIPPYQLHLSNYLDLIAPKVAMPKIEMVDPNVKLKILKEQETNNNNIAKKYLGQERLFIKEMPSSNPNWAPYKMNVDDMAKVSALFFSSILMQIAKINDRLELLTSQNKKGA